MLELSLERVQQWMQAVIVHPQGTVAAAEAGSAQAFVPLDRVGDVILPSQTLTSIERLEIYRGMYPLRMIEALQNDYEAVAHLLGEQAFSELVLAYVEAHPSRSYTLNRLGDLFPEFVRDNAPPSSRAFCHDLACLERAVNEVFDAPETPALSVEAIASIPTEAWECARLVPVAAFRLLKLAHNANAYLQTVQTQDHKHPKPLRRACYVAVYRRDYTLYRLELTRAEHALLKDLAAGQALGEAVALALRGTRRPPSEGQLFGWFREWVAAGMFRAVQSTEYPKNDQTGV